MSALVYQENDSPITYDELLLWASDTAAHMSQQQSVGAEVLADGKVQADYGHATILWSGKVAPKILELHVVEPNLACPRGVFLSNPVRKILAYYPSLESVQQERQTIYLEETQRLQRPAWLYGYGGGDKITYGALCQAEDGSYDRLELVFEIEDDVVAAIHFQRGDGLTDRQHKETLEGLLESAVTPG